MRKKILIAAGALVGLSLATLAVLPFLFKDRIVARARAEIDSAVGARVDWSGVGLTFFSSFPNLTLSLADLTAVVDEPFAEDTLVSMTSLQLVLDVGSVVRGYRGTGAVLVRSVRLEAPVVRLKVLADGSTNWDIAQPASREGAAASEPDANPAQRLTLELRDLAVTGGSLTLDDERSGSYAALSGLEHTLDGDFSRDRFVVRTRTHADAATLRFAGIPYLEGVALDFQADVDADMTGRRFAFADNELRLNGLVLNFTGNAVAADEHVDLDVTFAAPRTEFAQMLSLVPVVYARDFQALETSGSFSLDGHVRGRWGPGAFPAFALNAEIADGAFKYPDLPLPARDISLHLAVSNPGGDIDSTVVGMERFHMRMGDQPIDASLTLRTPVSDPDVDVSVSGTLDLANVVRTVKLGEGVEELSGVVRGDAAVRARRSDVVAKRYERISARGTVGATGLTVRTQALPHAVSVQTAALEMSPRRAEVKALQMQVGGSDFQATGSLDNLLGYVLAGEVLTGRATFASRQVTLDEWKSDAAAVELIRVPAGIDLALNGTVAQMTLGVLEMSDGRGGLHVKDQRVTLDDFSVRMLGGRIGFDGYYETVDSLPTFAVGLAIDSLDIPSASAALLTVRTLAPVAQFARGGFSARIDLKGALGSGLMPVFDALDGSGSLLTTALALEGFPALARLSDALSLPQLANPTFQAIRSSVEIRGGRLHVRPFRVGVGDFRMGVSGSNGVDQSLDYSLVLALPRAALGSGAERAVDALISKAGRAGLELRATDTIEVNVGITGTIRSPSIQTDFGGVASSAGGQVRQAVADAGQQRLDAATQRIDAAAERADSTAVEAERRARARADSIVQDAEERAEAIRAEARMLADGVRAEADRRADQAVAEAGNPVARAAARALADRVRREADDRATRMVEEADRRAAELVAAARERAEAIVRGG